MIPNTAVRLIARSCLFSLFIPSAFDKLLNWDEAIQQAKQGPMPKAAETTRAAVTAVADRAERASTVRGRVIAGS